MKRTIKALNELPDSLSETEHQKKFGEKLDNWDVKSPSQLKEDEKSKFFDEVKKKNFADELPIQSNRRN